MHESDPAIVARARGGDIDAFRLLVERHSRYLYGVVFRLTRNAEDTQDVVQDTWLKVHAQLGRFESRSEVRTWLTRIAVNCAIDFLRSSKRREAAYAPVDLEERVAPVGVVTPPPGAARLVLAGEIEARVGESMSCLATIERAATGRPAPGSRGWRARGISRRGCDSWESARTSRGSCKRSISTCSPP